MHVFKTTSLILSLMLLAAGGAFAGSITVPFDTIMTNFGFNPATTDGNGSASGAKNGILDSDELAVLAKILNDVGDANHTAVHTAFDNNVNRLLIDFAPFVGTTYGVVPLGATEVGYLATLFGGYVTLGDANTFARTQMLAAGLCSMVSPVVTPTVMLNPVNFDFSQANVLSLTADTDADTWTNLMEYKVIPGAGGPGTPKRTAYLAALYAAPTATPTMFDTIMNNLGFNPLTTDGNGSASGLPNGILDSDEAAVLAAIVGNVSDPNFLAVDYAYLVNVNRMATDLAPFIGTTYGAVPLDAPTVGLLAQLFGGYVTLGDANTFARTQMMVAGLCSLVTPNVTPTVMLDAANYNLTQAGVLSLTADTDGDTWTNLMEYKTIAGAGGPGSAKRTAYLAALYAAPTATPTMFDTIMNNLGFNPLTTDGNGSATGLPNGILDSDEAAVLAAIVGNVSDPNFLAVDYAYLVNVARMTTDLAPFIGTTYGAVPLDAPTVGLLAQLFGGYVTLGDANTFARTQMMVAGLCSMVTPNVTPTVMLSAANYNLTQAGVLSLTANTDADAWTNLMEYQVIPGAGGPGSAKRTAYLAALYAPATAIPTMFDTIMTNLGFNPLTTDGNGSASGDKNGILDSDELAVLGAILGNTSDTYFPAVSHAYLVNVNRMATDLAPFIGTTYGPIPLDAPTVGLLAQLFGGYVTLGDANTFARTQMMVAGFCSLVTPNVTPTVMLSAANYNLTQAGVLSLTANTDADAWTNVMEYQVIPGAGGPGSAKRTAYLAALNAPATAIPTMFDTIMTNLGFNPFTTDGNGSASGAKNGILDSDELAVLAVILGNTSDTYFPAVSHAYLVNVNRMTTDLAPFIGTAYGALPLDAPTVGLLAQLFGGYVTLGDANTFARTQMMVAGFCAAVTPAVTPTIMLDSANYNLTQAGVLASESDPDGDTLKNRVEYITIIGVGGPGSAKRTQYITDIFTANAPTQECDTCTPTTGTVAVGQDVCLQAPVTDGVNYQWSYKGQPLVESATVIGVNCPNLRLLGIQTPGTDEYSCTYLNALGQPGSYTAPMTVIVPVPAAGLLGLCALVAGLGAAGTLRQLRRKR